MQCTDCVSCVFTGIWTDTRRFTTWAKSGSVPATMTRTAGTGAGRRALFIPSLSLITTISTTSMVSLSTASCSSPVSVMSWVCFSFSYAMSDLGSMASFYKVAGRFEAGACVSYVVGSKKLP